MLRRFPFCRQPQLRARNCYLVHRSGQLHTLTMEFAANTTYYESMKGFGAIEWLARAGFLVKGVLYMIIGALALQVAARAGGRVTRTTGALTTVLAQPFGRTLLLVAAIGLLGYAAW